MKRNVMGAAALALALCLLLAACGGQGASPSGSKEDAVDSGYVPAAEEDAPGAFLPPKSAAPPELEETEWQIVSIDAGDYGVTEEPIGDPELYGGAASLPLDKLIAFSLSSDGAAAEDLNDGLRKRFLEAPRTVLAYLTLMGDQKDAYWDQPAAEVICRNIASTDAAMYGGTEEFTKTLAACREAYPTGRAAELLDVLEREHAASMERNYGQSQPSE